MDEDILVGDIQMIDETGALVASTTGARFWYLDRDARDKANGGLKKEEGSVSGKRILSETDPEVRRTLLETYLAGQVAWVLKLPASSSLDSNQPISATGFDSLMAVELRDLIEEDLGQVIPMVKFLQGFSISELTDLFLKELIANPATSSVHGFENGPSESNAGFGDEGWEEGIL
jgi:acyl carrier protein